MACSPHNFEPIPRSEHSIAGFRCASCSATFVASARVTDDGEHTDWFAGEINPEIKRIMNAENWAENLKRLEAASSQPPLVKEWFYAGRDL